MPTGYTVNVQNGKISSLEEFTLTCARAFGALIEMRDDPLDKEIPEKLSKETHASSRLIELISEKSNLLSLTREELQLQRDQNYNNQLDYYYERLEDLKVQRERYSKMLDLVKQWTPPSENHNGIKEFMIEQLNSSLEIDCMSLERYLTLPKKLTVEEYKNQQLADLDSRINYYRKEVKKENERNKSRQEWVDLLRESVKGK